MRRGLSLVDGAEYDAGDVTYEDVTTKQIVCPICKEAMVKVRVEHAGGVTDYLRHRRRGASELQRRDQDECELRDALRASGGGTPSRGQTLERFLLHLDGRIKDTALTYSARMVVTGIEPCIHEVTAHPRAMQFMARWLAERTRNRECVASYVSRDNGGRRILTLVDKNLDEATNDRHYDLVLALWDHLNTEVAEDNLHILMQQASMLLVDEARACIADLLYDTNEDDDEVMEAVRLRRLTDSFATGLRQSGEPPTETMMLASVGCWMATLLDGSDNGRISMKRKKLIKASSMRAGTTAAVMDGICWKMLLAYALKILRLMVVLDDGEAMGTLVSETGERDKGTG